MFEVSHLWRTQSKVAPKERAGEPEQGRAQHAPGTRASEPDRTATRSGCCGPCRDEASACPFKVTNWAEYDPGLRCRDSLTLWVTDEAIQGWQAAPPYRNDLGLDHDQEQSRTSVARSPAARSGRCRIGNVTAEGTYDGMPTYDAAVVHGKNITVVVPPTVTAVLNADAVLNPSQRDQHIAMILAKGRPGWQKETEYGQRSPATSWVTRQPNA